MTYNTEDVQVEAYKPSDKQRDASEFLSKRVNQLKEGRKKSLVGVGRSIEDVWREVDREYTPHELNFDKMKKRLESDDETGLRSSLIKLGTEGEWQSNQASPDFYVKVQSAMSILVDMNPEAVFIPNAKKYEKSTELAYGNWKNSWEVSGAKQQIKNFIFNMAKYGTGFGRTYPKIVEMDKKVRIEYYKDNPEKDKYEDRKIIKYNDLCRESLNPWQVWVSESARPGDPLSMDDWYYEMDYSWDKFQQHFKDYKNVKSVSKNSYLAPEGIENHTEVQDGTVTVGFYENQVTDTYIVWIPSSGIVLYESPLPNDDGMLSLWYAPWTLRDDRSIYGIGIFEIIRQDSVMYDRLMNMTLDQLTLSIYKMFFYKGTDLLGENSQLVVSAGVGKQVSDPSAITFLNVPGPGSEAWQGLQYIQNKRDLNSGVNQQLSGEYSGKTLGQDLQAKEASLQRMKTPLDYLLDSLQYEAYLSLSWQKQILSTPEILEYTDPEMLSISLKEMGLDDEQVNMYMQEINQPKADSELVFSDGTTNEQTGDLKKYVNVYKETSLNLDKDEKGELIESEKNRFFRFGLDLPTKRLNWKGIIRIKPQSILVPSKELSKRQKLDMFNLLYPAIQAMLASPQFIPALLPPIKQIIKVNEQDIKDWIDEKFMEQLMQQSMQPKGEPQPELKPSMSIKYETLTPEIQVQVLEKFLGLKVQKPLFVKPGASVQEQLGLGTPQGEVSRKFEVGGASGPEASMEIERETAPRMPVGNVSGGAETIQPIAQIGQAPETMQGAVTGATEL